MHPTALPSRFARHAAHAYQSVGREIAITDADPHRLIELLFDGLFEALAQGRGALRAGQVEAKCRALGKAVSIVQEGLRGGLNLDAGGALAADLDALYDYVTRRLTLANLKNDESLIEECVQLLEPLRQAWKAIRAQAV